MCGYPGQLSTDPEVVSSPWQCRGKAAAVAAISLLRLLSSPLVGQKVTYEEEWLLIDNPQQSQYLCFTEE